MLQISIHAVNKLTGKHGINNFKWKITTKTKKRGILQPRIHMKQNRNKQQNTDNEIKFMRPMANYTWMDHKRNEALLKELKQNPY
jgi:hypothetical protein